MEPLSHIFDESRSMGIFRVFAAKPSAWKLLPLMISPFFICVLFQLGHFAALWILFEIINSASTFTIFGWIAACGTLAYHGGAVVWYTFKGFFLAKRDQSIINLEGKEEKEDSRFDRALFNILIVTGPLFMPLLLLFFGCMCCPLNRD
jgi:hypothetical protein